MAARDGHRRAGCCNEDYRNEGREAGADRGWPEKGAVWIDCNGGREPGADRGWPEKGAVWIHSLQVRSYWNWSGRPHLVRRRV
jgi:hypothetical protein